MRPIHPTSADTPVVLGAKLRAARLAQGITLEQLAEATGLTKGFLSRVERDDTMPSVPTLVQLCQALSIPIGNLFEEPDLHHLPLDAAPRINMGGEGADERLVTPRTEERVQVLRSTLAPGAHGGEQLYTVNCNLETLHVVEGSMTITMPDRVLEMAAGDTLTFPGHIPHNWQAGKKGAKAVWVLVPAAWSGSS